MKIYQNSINLLIESDRFSNVLTELLAISAKR